jgi:bifunctional UDP-N-acetylglucosamine pyrophosphorylase / glucosamine-1-phosphate N-acetyltransferase
VQTLSLDDPAEMIGINNRVHLAEATAHMQARINQQMMLAGVTLVHPASIYIEPEVRIGADCVIWPNTYLKGKTSIGARCTIGPGTIMEDTTAGNDCRILASVLEQAHSWRTTWRWDLSGTCAKALIWLLGCTWVILAR